MRWYGPFNGIFWDEDPTGYFGCWFYPPPVGYIPWMTWHPVSDDAAPEQPQPISLDMERARRACSRPWPARLLAALFPGTEGRL